MTGLPGLFSKPPPESAQNLRILFRILNCDIFFKFSYLPNKKNDVERIDKKKYIMTL